MVRNKVLEWLFVRDKQLHHRLVAWHVIGELESSESGHYTTPPIAPSTHWFENCAAILRERDTNNPY